MNVTWITERAEQIRAIQREIEQPGAGRSQFRRVCSVRDVRGDSLDTYTGDALAALVRNYAPCKPGDLVYVREAHLFDDDDKGTIHRVLYRADYDEKDLAPGWRSPVTMPRWASRYTLLIEDVWVHRVRDIRAPDAQAEGLTPAPVAGIMNALGTGYKTAFAEEWVKRHGPGSWDRNDWVWAVKFRPIAANVDDVLADPARFGVETGR